MMRSVTPVAFAIALLLNSASIAAAERPNVVLVLADDLGITDIAAYASHFSGKPIVELYYETPNMDRLVQRGVAFSQYYANQLCSPTRAALMTGQHAARHGFTTATPRTKTYYNQGLAPPAGFNPHDVLMHKDKIPEQQAWTNGRSNTALDPSLPTLPKVLKSHRSAFIGKWHLYSFVDLNAEAWNANALSDKHNYQISEVKVDDIWAANRVRFALHTVGQRQYVAYYDRNRMMTVACRDIDDETWQKTTLPNKLSWDSHNSVVLGIDKQGYIHVSGNMHVNPLCYFRSERPHDISRMNAHSMLGREEDRVTYPRFFYDHQNTLLYSYRYGTCGDGNILVNRFEPKKQRWVRHLDTPLFEGVGSNGDRAAYHRFTRDANGHFHFIWMWRWTPMVETCHQLCYATSPDLIHWKNASGKPVDLPFRPDLQSVIVDDAPSKGGLHNSRYQIIVSPDGAPFIGYVKYDEAGLTQLYLAKHDGEKWLSKQISDWKFRWKFVEGGDQMTTGGSFQLAGFTDQGSLAIPWSTEQETAGQYFVDIKTLEPTNETMFEPIYPKVVNEPLSNAPSLLVNLAADTGDAQESGVRYVLKWEAREGSHGKHAPKVIPKGPTSKLVVLQIK